MQDKHLNAERKRCPLTASATSDNMGISDCNSVLIVDQTGNSSLQKRKVIHLTVISARLIVCFLQEGRTNVISWSNSASPNWYRIWDNSGSYTLRNSSTRPTHAGEMVNQKSSLQPCGSTGHIRQEPRREAVRTGLSERKTDSPMHEGKRHLDDNRPGLISGFIRASNKGSPYFPIQPSLQLSFSKEKIEMCSKKKSENSK